MTANKGVSVSAVVSVSYTSDMYIIIAMVCTRYIVPMQSIATCSVCWLSSVLKQAVHTFTKTDSSDFLALIACDGDGLLRELADFLFFFVEKNMLGSPF